MHTTSTTTTTFAALALTGALLLGACGEDTDASTETPPAQEDDVTPEPAIVEIAMNDFSYGGLPPELAAGSKIAVTNTSETEIHEFVAFRLDDDDARPVEEIVETDLERLLTESVPTAVLIAPPGGEQIEVIGDGTIDEPGRYLVVCVIPTGADPDEYLDAAANSEGPPQVAGGAPHVANGMYAEFTVRG